MKVVSTKQTVTAPTTRCTMRSRVLPSSNSGLSTGPPNSGRYSFDLKSIAASSHHSRGRISRGPTKSSIRGQVYRYARLRCDVPPRNLSDTPTRVAGFSAALQAAVTYECVPFKAHAGHKRLKAPTRTGLPFGEYLAVAKNS